MHLDVEAPLVGFLVDALPRLEGTDFQIFQRDNPNSRFDRFCSDGVHFSVEMAQGAIKLSGPFLALTLTLMARGSTEPCSDIFAQHRAKVAYF